MLQLLDLQLIDLSSIKAIAHNGSCLQVLVATQNGYRVITVEAPTAALAGLLQLSQLLAGDPSVTAIASSQPTDNISMLAVTSSTIAAVGYTADAQILQVDFCSGSRYRYYNVQASVFTAFLNAPSKGRFLNRVIKAEYSFKCVVEHK